jgi:hypothetical protein
MHWGWVRRQLPLYRGDSTVALLMCSHGTLQQPWRKGPCIRTRRQGCEVTLQQCTGSMCQAWPGVALGEAKVGHRPVDLLVYQLSIHAQASAPPAKHHLGTCLCHTVVGPAAQTHEANE